MRRILLYIYILAFAILFMAPTLQNLFSFLPPQKLEGVEYSSDLPKLTMESWLDGSFQTKFESWYEKVYGLRNYLVRSENQINFTMFHQISNRSLVLGKQNTLFEEAYILDAVGLNTVSTEQIENIAINLRKLQDFLNSRGIHFLFVITPSKATIYPEYLPDHFANRRHAQSILNYDNLLPFLHKYDINYLDGHAYLQSLKSNCYYTLFCRGGTHWNYYAAYLFTREIMHRLEVMLGKRLDELDHQKVFLHEKPVGSDDDLARLANLWDSSALIQESPYPEVSKITVADSIRPNVLFVGGSFVYAILHWLNAFEIMDKRSEFSFYFSQKKISDMQKEIFSRDVIILETNEQALSRSGFGFIEAVLDNSGLAAAN